MNRAVFLIAATLACAVAQAQGPIVHAHLEPTSGIIVGQPVRLVVEVLVPNYFTGSPDFPEFELENAIVVLPQERAQNTSERIGATTYAGITETYTLYPQQPGDFQLPPAEVGVTYAATPPKSTTARVALPELKFHADLPPAAQGMSYFLPTTRLTLQQKWDNPLKSVHAGDTLTRTLTVTATKMQAMLIPPLPMDVPDGIRVYQAEPSVQDYKTSRGDFVYGRRVQSAQYLIQKAGDYTLPSVELKWWNLSTRRMETAILPAVHFTAVPNPQIATELPPEPEPVMQVQPEQVSLWRRYGKAIEMATAVALGILLFVWLAVRFMPKIVHGTRAWRSRVTHGEPYCFKQLLNTCHANDASAAYAKLLHWLALRQPGVSLTDFITDSRNAELSTEIEGLGKTAYGAGVGRAGWNGSALAHALKYVRKKKAHAASGKKSLPQMNPAR